MARFQELHSTGSRGNRTKGSAFLPQRMDLPGARDSLPPPPPEQGAAAKSLPRQGPQPELVTGLQRGPSLLSFAYHFCHDLASDGY